jgi:hypothetical protein
MAINWDEVKRKGQQKGAAAEAQVQFKRAVPSLPKAPPKLPMNISFGSVLDEYNTSLPGIGNQVAKNLAPERKQEIAQGTRRFFEQAPVQAGFMQGVSFNNPLKSLERKLSTDIDTTQAEKSNFYKAGEIGGIMTQFALPYAGASKGIAAGLTKLPKYAQLGKFGQGVARSVATDLAVGLPLNVNYAYNKEGLQGKEAAKSIALNTGIDLIAGGILEAVPMFLKSGKKVASKADFDNLPPAEKTEIMSELEQLAYESNVRKGKVTPQNDTLYGNSFRQSAGELPAPAKQGRTGVNTKSLKERPEIENIHLGGYQGQDNYVLKAYDKDGNVIGKVDYSEYEDIPSVGMIEVPEQYRRQGIAKDLLETLQKRYPNKSIDFGYTTDDGTKLLNKVTTDKVNPSYTSLKGHIDRAKKDLEDISKRFDEGKALETDEEDFYRLDSFITKASRSLSKLPEKIQTVNLPNRNSFKELPRAMQPKQPNIYANAIGQREVPRTVTPNELPRVNKVQPQPLPQAPTKPAQPILSQKGTEIPKEQPFAKNEDLRNNFSQAHGEKFEADYNNFMKETEDLPDVQTGASEFAQRITSKGVSRGKDIQRIADSALRHSKEAREWFKRTVEDPLYVSKGKYATEVKTKLDDLHETVVKKLGIKLGSKEDAAIQWYGDGAKQRKSGKNTSTETMPYTLDDLKADFNYTMPNGKKAWENIVQAEAKAKGIYVNYVDRINESLKKIYPNVEENVAKLQAKLAKTTDPEARKAVLQEIEDATVGKRLYPRKDYMRHFQEMKNSNFLVGLDNIINGATNIDPRLIGVSEFTKPNSKWTGFLQRRKDGDIYTESGLGGLLDYIPQAEYKINIEPNIPILRGVIKELKESTIQSRNANSFIDELMQITNDLAGKSNKWDRNFADFFGDEKGRKVLNGLSAVSNRMRKNAVMGNVNSMIAQFFNLPNVVGYAKNPVDLADGFKTAIQAATGNQEAKALLDKSMFLKERYIDRSFRQFNTGILDNAEKFFSWTMELGDKAIADGAWLTFYKQAIKTMDESSAVLKADEMTRKSIGGRGIAEMPLSQKAKVTKLFAPFQVEVRNAVNVLEDLGRAKDVGGLVGVFVTSYLLNEVLKATTGREIGFNPFGTVQDSIEDGSNVVAGLVGNTITNIPGGSYVASAGASALGLSEYQMQELFGQNDPSRFGTGNIALQTLAAPVGQAIKGQNIDPIKPLAATLPRFGGKQLERGIRGLQDMAVLPKEKINLTEGISAKKQDFPASLSQSGRLRFAIEPNVQNYLTAPTLGTWSTKEGKDYIENERQPLGEKQTSNVDSLYRLGIEPKMAETIIRGLSGLTKKEEKMQFINTMNLDKSTKKTLLEDILGYSTDNIKPEERIDFGIDKAGLTSDQRTTYKSSVAPLGIDDKTYARIVNEMDANGSGRVSHEEAQAILDSTNLTREQKYKMWNVIDARWVEKNNPYR